MKDESQAMAMISQQPSLKQEYFHFEGMLSSSRDRLFVGSVSGFEYPCLFCIEHLANL